MGDFTLTTPITRASESKYVVDVLRIARSGPTATIDVSVQDSGGLEDIRRAAFTIPSGAFPSATVSGFLGALLNSRASETGTNARKANFRALGYLVDQGMLPPGVLNA